MGMFLENQTELVHIRKISRNLSFTDGLENKFRETRK